MQWLTILAHADPVSDAVAHAMQQNDHHSWAVVAAEVALAAVVAGAAALIVRGVRRAQKRAAGQG